jgi:hypothetical protein
MNVTNHIETAFDRHDYEMRVNQKVIARLEKQREEGLPACLRRAAETAQNATRMRVAKVLMHPGNTE